VAIINGLKQAGVSVRVYDPQGMEHARNVLTGVELCDSVLDACRGADCMVLATEWQQFRSLDARACAKIMRGRTIIELRSNLLDHDALVDEGFTIHNIGRAVRRRELARGQAD
jgi:UDPglucose 6-dehydrogenase